MKSKIIRLLYQNLLKPIFFQLDPENVHDFMTWVGMALGKSKIAKKITSFFLSYSNPSLEQKILGMKFKNPVGLAAGFDKNGRLTDILPSLGFGFMEIGTITGERCQGNPKPRLWRLTKSNSIRVYLGLNNNGSKIISAGLKHKEFNIPLITNIGKTNSLSTIETEAGIADYLKAYKSFVEIGDFLNINISCPNAFGGKHFSDPVKLDKLLTKIDKQSLRSDDLKIPTHKPIFIKMPPSLTDKQLDQIIEVVGKHKISGFVCSNLSERGLKTGPGGVSGKLLEDLANRQIRAIYQKTKGKYVIIGCGGIFSAEDAYEKIKLGASLVQLITGMIFEGPQLIGEINRGLVKLLQKDGYKNISEAIGRGPGN